MTNKLQFISIIVHLQSTNYREVEVDFDNIEELGNKTFKSKVAKSRVAKAKGAVKKAKKRSIDESSDDEDSNPKSFF